MYPNVTTATPYPQPAPQGPNGSGLATSSVYEATNDASDQPILASLIERAALNIPDDLINDMLGVARSPDTRNDRAAKSLEVILSGRDKCFRVFSRAEQPRGALAASYRRYDCPEPTSPPMYRPLKAPCNTRAHKKCECHWAKREVKKRARKFAVFTAERGGATLLVAEWLGTDTKVRGDAWRAFRRSHQRPAILSRGMFFHEETPNGRRTWMLLPKVNDDELSVIQGLWREITQRHMGSAAHCFVVERVLEPVSGLRDMADRLSEHEARSQRFDLTQSAITGEVGSVDEVAVALYLLARKAVFVMLLEGTISLPEGLIRFSKAIEKDAATFGADMEEVDAPDEQDDADNAPPDDGDPESPTEGDSGGSEPKPLPCPLHPGVHLMNPTDETVDFTRIERWFLTEICSSYPTAPSSLRATLTPPACCPRRRHLVIESHRRA